MNIVWRGTEHTNKSSRRNQIPIGIVSHITGGSAKSADSWFRSAGNDDSSAHFLVTKTGKIYQYVGLEYSSWCNGLTSGYDCATAEIVGEKGKDINPNWYTISIEHEGQKGSKLTQAQLEATILLHEHIIKEVKRIYGYDIPRNRKHILGHYEFDCKRKPFCPGKYFPFNAILERLNSANKIHNVSQKFDLKGTKLEVPGIIINNKSYIATRDLFESNGDIVDWDNETKTIIIKEG